MIQPANIVQRLLIGASLGGDPESAHPVEWPVFINSQPDDPDNCLTVVDTTGINDGRLHIDGSYIDHPGIQLVLRASNSFDGYQKLWEIQQHLDEEVYDTVVILPDEETGLGTGGGEYTIHAFSRKGMIIQLGQDPNNQSRFLFTLNYTITL